ncbi:MAG: PTS glucose transporter subunit IIA [Pseudonocardiaceae bacterium]
MTVRVRSPVTGRVLPLSEVTDPTFAQGMVGPGVALDPEDAMSTALSPVTGVVALVGSHAFILTTAEGAAVLVHLGIETVALRGQGFTPHVLHGEIVRTGQPVISWDPAAVRASGRSALCPVIALDATATNLLQHHHPGPITAGDPLFDWRH